MCEKNIIVCKTLSKQSFERKLSCQRDGITKPISFYTYLDLMEFPWISWNLHGFLRISQDFVEFHRISWNFHGFRGISTGFRRISIDFVEFPGISWNFRGFHGISWDFMEFPRDFLESNNNK